MAFKCLAVSMILIVLLLVQINASKYRSVRQTPEQCESPTFDFCQFIDCVNGECKQNLTNADCYTCKCVPGFIGKLCDEPITTQIGCTPSCLNDGTCLQTGANTYACTCPANFTGDHCQTNVLETHPCITSPTICRNGGTCTIYDSSYLCHCPPGWTGRNCETQSLIATCNPNPCGAQGTCMVATGPTGPIAVCVCEAQWTGKFCDVSIGSLTTPNPVVTTTSSGTTSRSTVLPVSGNCASNPCSNRGDCYNSGSSFICFCKPQWSGPTCSEPALVITTTVSPPTVPTSPTTPGGTTSHSTVLPVSGNCASNPCSNRGDCFNSGSSFICFCKPQWSGPTCSEPALVITTTVSPPTVPTSPTTPPGWTTSRSTAIPVSGNCASNPCSSRGDCFNTGSSFICFCKPQWSGPTCSESATVTPAPSSTPSPNANACQPNPCYNGGSCFRHGSSYVCACTPQYTGSTCASLKPTTVPTITPPTPTCANAPCRNGGTCYSNGASYVCYCGGNSGFTGKNCETSILTPSSNCPLQCGSGQCVRTGGSGTDITYACFCNGILTPTTCSM